MLVQTMTPQEISKEILDDYHATLSTRERLAEEYDKKRKKLKVSRDITFPVSYEIKTHKKNTWIFIYSKPPSDEKYDGAIDCCELVYFQDYKGLRVFKINPSGGLSAFNAHLFWQYNKRMGLGLSKLLDVIKHFFSNSGFFTYRILPEDNEELTFAVCRDGFLLGKMQKNRLWVVHKTFITRNLAYLEQEKNEEKLIRSLQSEIEKEINNPSSINELNAYKADVLKGIIKK